MIQTIILYFSLFLGLLITFRLVFIQIRVLPNTFQMIKHRQNRQILSLGLAGLFGISSIYAIALGISKGGPGSLVWMCIFTIIAMATRFYTTGINIRLKNESGHTHQRPTLYTRLQNLPGFKPLAILSAITITLVGIFYAAYTQIQLLNTSSTFTLISPIKPISIVLIGVVAALTFLSTSSKQKTILSFLSMTTTIFLMGITTTIWIKYQPQAFFIIKLILNDAFSGKAALSGALSSTILSGFIYSCLALQSGFSPANIAYEETTTLSPRQAGSLAVLEPLLFTLSATFCIASLMIFTGSYGSYQYSRNSPFYVGFERSALTALPPGWALSQNLPKDHSILKHTDGKKVLECNASVPNTDSIFLPRMPISSTTGIRFGYYKISGDMEVQILQPNGMPIGKILLNENNKPVILSNKVRIWLEGAHKTTQWESYTLRFDDFSGLNIPNDSVMLQFTPLSTSTHWLIDKIEPVGKPELPEIIKNNFVTIFPKMGETLYLALFSLLTLICCLSWLKNGEIALQFLTSNPLFLRIYQCVFLGAMVAGLTLAFKLPLTLLLFAILLILIINGISMFVSLNKYKDAHHE